MKRLLGLVALAAALAGLGAVGSAPGSGNAGQAPGLRILYSSDWSGTREIYAVDPSGRSPVAQLTFGRPAGCTRDLNCGFSEPEPSPDGRHLLLWDWVEGGYRGLAQGLFVASPDGRARRLIRRFTLADLRVFSLDAVWAPDSHGFAYAGPDGVHVVQADGVHNVRVDGTSAGDSAVAWSPSGDSLSFCRAGHLVVSPQGTSIVTATSGNSCFPYAWSPTGKWIAYTSDKYQVTLVSPDGRRHRTIGRGLYPAWSPDGQLLAFDDYPIVDVYDLASRKTLTVKNASFAGWSPDGLLAVGTDVKTTGLRDATAVALVDARTGAMRRRITENGGKLVWAPGGREFAYETRLQDFDGQTYGSDLQVGTPARPPHTVVAAAGDYGGDLGGFVWTRPPPGTHYRPATRRTIATVTSDGLTAAAPTPIDRLAVDGNRVAYVSCGHVYVWTPSTGSVVQTEPVASTSLLCTRGDNYTPFAIYGLALADDNLAYGTVCCNNTKSWTLLERNVQPRSVGTLLGVGYTSGPSEYPTETGHHFSNPTGSGSLLVFNSWDTKFGPAGSVIITSESILKAPPGGCPCPVLRTEPGPLIIDDVDAGRIVAHGDNAVLLLDANGKQLLTIPLAAEAAALSGNDLAVLAQGQLRDYDATDGSLEHMWPLPAASVTSDCTQEIYGCSYSRASLRLQDAARGVVAYVLDDQLHLLRLADGKDTTMGPSSHARFMNAGLVYADGSRIHLVPYDRLPLR
jgi:Tol biopolymer transport system component